MTASKWAGVTLAPAERRKHAPAIVRARLVFRTPDRLISGRSFGMVSRWTKEKRGADVAHLWHTVPKTDGSPCQRTGRNHARPGQLTAEGAATELERGAQVSRRQHLQGFLAAWT
jgi:hypothetical protein